jgi:hypothetical protein
MVAFGLACGVAVAGVVRLLILYLCLSIFLVYAFPGAPLSPLRRPFVCPDRLPFGLRTPFIFSFAITKIALADQSDPVFWRSICLVCARQKQPNTQKQTELRAFFPPPLARPGFTTSPPLRPYRRATSFLRPKFLGRRPGHSSGALGYARASPPPPKNGAVRSFRPPLGPSIPPPGGAFPACGGRHPFRSHPAFAEKKTPIVSHPHHSQAFFPSVSRLSRFCSRKKKPPSCFAPSPRKNTAATASSPFPGFNSGLVAPRALRLLRRCAPGGRLWRPSQLARYLPH